MEKKYANWLRLPFILKLLQKIPLSFVYCGLKIPT